MFKVTLLESLLGSAPPLPHSAADLVLISGLDAAAGTGAAAAGAGAAAAGACAGVGAAPPPAAEAEDGMKGATAAVSLSKEAGSQGSTIGVRNSWGESRDTFGSGSACT
jgi:hypothetical protein